MFQWSLQACFFCPRHLHWPWGADRLDQGEKGGRGDRKGVVSTRKEETGVMQRRMVKKMKKEKEATGEEIETCMIEWE